MIQAGDWAGTGFTIEVDGRQYLITAKHVIANIREDSVDGLVLIRINDKNGSFTFITSRASDWSFHPDDVCVDVAAIPWAPDQTKFDYLTYPHEAFLSDKVIQEQNIGVGDEVFMTGLFASHYGKQRNVPIVRIGNIACVPEEPIDTKSFGPIEAYIIEARSIGGLSGSPVFVNLGAVRIGEGITIGGGARHFLLGLIHGHWDITDEINDAIAVDATLEREGKINMGMAIVVPFHKITEVLNQPDFNSRRAEQIEHRRKENLPTEDNGK